MPTRQLSDGSFSDVVSIASIDAGELHLGAVSGQKITMSVEITRESNATPYTAGDIVSTAAAAVTSAGGFHFTNLFRAVGVGGYIVAARLTYNVKSVVPRTRAHLFNASTATVSGDNLPHREAYADASKRCGAFDMAAMVTGTDTTNSDMSRSINMDLRVPVVPAADSRDLWVDLETLDGVTLTSGSKATLTLTVELD